MRILGLLTLIHVLFVLFLLVTTVYGVVLAFKASVVLGIIVLIVEPSPLILGAAALLGHPELAQRLAHFLGL